ncbi:MAG: hypothetical protein QXU67_06365 [Candidatus Bathyarchaeia archaeon]
MGQGYISEKHKSAIISACIALRKYLKDLRVLMIKGESPESTGFSGIPMPLSEAEAAQLEKDLLEIEQTINKIEERVGRDILNDTPDPMLTRMWASVILGRMEGVLRIITPGSLERTRGPMPQELRDFLSDEISMLEVKVRTLRNKYTTAKF